MEQINTFTNQSQNNNINSSAMNQSYHNPAVSEDVEKLQLQEMVQDYMNQIDINKRIRNMLSSAGSQAKNNTRFNVNMDELRQYNPRLVAFVTKDPLGAIKMFQDSLNNNIKGMREDGAGAKGMNSEKMQAVSADNNFPKKAQVYYVNFDGNFGRNHVTPRGLRAEILNQYVAVSGIVTRMSIVKPRLQTSVHYCEENKRGYFFHKDDKYNLNLLAKAQDQTKHEENLDDNQGFRTHDNQGNALSAEYGYCVYRDYQEITIQEMPERAPTGQLPRSIRVILQDDLVDRVKPGDRVQVTGVFRANMNEQGHNAMTSNFILATGISNIQMEREKPNLNETDIKNIKKIAKEKELFEILGGSVASSIEGMQSVKKALLLQLLGGAEKNLENGTHLRGDINILMVGDPSTAKSQLLRHVMDIAPLAINTTGRGSTGVGLTAAVTMDKDTNEKHLEAGAMVLADRGVVCIDEFDKMNDADRVAIHEVMEQQTVTIAKAGIHVSLNARCSVIAAANPIYGEYARDQPVGRNIGMPDSLLSRFDLLFVMLDEKDPDNDRKIAERVIANHRFQNPNNANLASVFHYTNDDVIIEQDFNAPESKERNPNQVYEKNLLNSSKLPVVTRDFLKKYLSYAKAQKAPELHQDCVEYAAQFYSLIRNKAQNYDQAKISAPITVRTLETMIRLATSHAKLRLSKTVDPSDIDVAIELLNQTIFQEEKTTEKENPEDENAEEEDEDMFDVGEEQSAKKNSASNRSQRYAQRRGAAVESPNKSEATTPSKKGKSPRQQITPSSHKKPVQEDPRPTKRLRTDIKKEATPTIEATEDVTKLFAAPVSTKTPAATTTTNNTTTNTVAIDMTQKKYLYKLISDNKGPQQKVTIDQLWKAYMAAPENETFKRGKAIVSSKQHLVQIVEELEKDNLVMYSNEDGNVVLI